MSLSTATPSFTVPSRASVREAVARIRQAVDTGDSRDAQRDAEQLLTMVAAGDRAVVLNALAHLHAASGDALTFARLAAEARDAAQMHEDAESQAEAILHTGQALQMIEDHAAAIKYFEDAEQRATRLKMRHLESRIWRRLGISSSIIGRHAQAVNYLERSVQACKELGGGADWFAARNSLYNAHNRRIEMTIAEGPERVEAYRPYLPRWQELADEAHAAGALRISAVARGNYAIARRHVEDFDGALETLGEVLQQYQAFQMRANIAITFNEMGTVYCQMKRYADALTAYQNALWHLEDGSKREQCESYAGISLAHEMQGDATAALAALKKVRSLEAELTDQEARAAAERRELTLSVKQFSEQWEKLAKEDSLTGLPNRRAMEQWLHSALSRATPAQPTTLMIIDVDFFKQVNDRYGHAIGDRTLHLLADLIRQNSRYADFPARYGGEEFVVALPQTDLATGADVAQRLNHSVSAYYWASIHPELAITISIGVASTTEMPQPYLGESLVELADHRLYAAKNAGRDRVVSR
ncbi:MAG: GGDEF domain-containing protein [Betaproteobacteria bacterium]|nr:GGDEF domain-containing protein [Betaproteobacteria bacterium]